MGRSSLARMAALALVWGSSFVWIKLALRGLSPLEIVVVRLALGAAILVVIARARGHRFAVGGRVWTHLLVAAAFANVAPFLLFGLGEERVDSALAGVLNSTTPLWAVTIALLVRHERRLGRWRGLGLVTGFGGVLLIFEPWDADLAGSTWGAIACLVAAASYGLGFVYMDHFLTGRGIDPIVLSSSQLTAATGLSVVALAVTAPFGTASGLEWRADALVSVAILGIFGTGIAYILNYRLISDEGSTAASTVGYLLPVVSVALGAIALGDPISVHVVLGALIVLAGVALTRVPQSGTGRVRPTVEAAADTSG